MNYRNSLIPILRFCKLVVEWTRRGSSIAAGCFPVS